ncbi:TraH family protein [Agrobacterium vitis]|uniref:TraH family protein n=1 Tax=Agrobacterium vitis TaxID=373 RepID=UPI0008DC2BCF|nr:TraH family protein [Agrobacterium vitis]MUO85232.1 conjugal transfer protein TraH [Agrobacterium vitis]
MDAAFIAECADPSLNPAIVEQFVAAVGPGDPLAVTVKAGGRLILVPKPKTPDEAMEIIRQYVGQAVVRVGLTQFPAGVGVKDASELKPDLMEPCENLRMGTRMFSKIMRIVAKWYGNPTSKEVLPQIFEDAVYAWNSGQFEGQSVFQAEDPGGAIVDRRQAAPDTADEPADTTPSQIEAEPSDEKEVGTAGIRVDLSRIGGQ